MASLAEAAATVNDGDIVAFGGKTLHRTPSAFVRELVRQDVSDLTLLGVASSIDIDLLCGTDSVSAVHFGYVGFEHLGLAPNLRAAVEANQITALEGTCYTVATMLRAAKHGLPFMPVRGLEGSDLVAVRDDFTQLTDPFSNAEIAVVRSVTPDVGVIHTTAADIRGNARFQGADLTEGLVARAAKETIVTTERIVEPETFQEAPERTNIPEVLVDTVVECPFGAHPCSAPGAYTYDVAHLDDYLSRSREDDLGAYLEAYLGESEAEYRAHCKIDERDIGWEGTSEVGE